MGRLMNPNEFIDTNIEKYNERATSQYATLLDTTPVFGTFYHQNRVFTTNDKGLENVEDDLGRDSPIKYDKIEKFPFYGADQFSLQMERGDMGLDTNTDFDLSILPDTVRPYPNDYFYLDSLGDRYLFKITDVQEDMIKAKPYYRISCRLSKIQEDDSSKEIEEQVLDNYTTIFNNIGTDNQCVVKSSTFRIIDMVNKINDKLIQFFIRNFYDQLYNVVTLRIHSLDVNIYSRYINKFIIDNNVLDYSDKKGDFYSCVKLVEYLPTNPDFDIAYSKTLYYAVSNQSPREFFCRFFNYMDVHYMHAPWFRGNIDYKDMILLGDVDEELEANEENGIMEFITKEFYGRIKMNLPFDNEDDYFMENLIIRYINGSRDLPTEDLLNKINKNLWRNDMRGYVFIPLIIFILRDLLRNETIKQL